MIKIKQKCYIDKYDIEINSDLTYEEGYGLLQKLFECIIINEEKPMGEVTIHFTDWTYGFPISKSDNIRIAKLLYELGFDREFVDYVNDFAC